MKHTQRITLTVTLLCGLTGSLLLGWFMSLRDEAGLLPALHPAKIAALLLAAVYVVFLVLFTRKLPTEAEVRMPGSKAGAVCMMLSGVLLIVYGVFGNFGSRKGLQLLFAAASGCAGVCLFLLAGHRQKGTMPPFWVTLVMPIYSILFTVFSTQNWGRDPQVITYLFPVLSALAVMLATYHYAAVFQKKSSVRSLQTWSQLALFFCMLAFSSQHVLYFLSMGLLMISFCISMPEETEL